MDTRNNGKATSATRAKNKYRDKTYDRMELALPKWNVKASKKTGNTMIYS